MSVFLIAVLAASARAQFSNSDKQEILDIHNNLRSQIAFGTFVAAGQTMPAAADMQKMIWSAELEAGAQAYSQNCVFAHSHAPGVGENLYYSWWPGMNNITGKGKDACNSWAQEFQDKGWMSVYFDINVFNSGVAHATQMAWAQTNQVGCGASLCQGGQQVLVVCQYKPQGNILGTNTYAEGATCSQCPDGTSCEQSSGLCASGVAPPPQTTTTTSSSDITTSTDTQTDATDTPSRCCQCC